MLAVQEWLVLLAGIKGWAGLSVAPLFVTALWVRFLRSRALAWLLIAQLLTVGVFGFFALGAAIVIADGLRPEVSGFPEGHISFWGAALTHVACLFLIIREQARYRRSEAGAPHGFEVIM